MGRKLEKRIQAENKFRFNYWQMRILKLAYSSIKANNMPQEIDTILMERTLNNNGSVIIGYDAIIDKFVCGSNASSGRLDYNRQPIDRKAVLYNGTEIHFNPYESVIIYNNSMRTSDLWIYDYYAMLMADLDGAIIANMNNQKAMPIIPVSETQRLSIENAYLKKTQNVPYVLVDKDGFDVNSIRDNSFSLGSTNFAGDKMMVVKKEYWNELLTFLGIDNLKNEKKERLITAEVNSGNDELITMREDRLRYRNKGAEELNILIERIRGKNPNISFEFNTDMNYSVGYDNTQFIDTTSAKEGE